VKIYSPKSIIFPEGNSRGEYDIRGWIHFHISWTRMLKMFYYTEWGMIIYNICTSLSAIWGVMEHWKAILTKAEGRGQYCFSVLHNKRLLHDIFHIGPGISPRLPYQARQRSWRDDMGRGLIPGTIWKISCHNLFITYFTLTFFSSIDFYMAEKIFELTNCENKSLRELPLFNLQIFLFRVLYNDVRKCL
jgi:hypothetical protein